MNCTCVLPFYQSILCRNKPFVLNLKPKFDLDVCLSYLKVLNLHYFYES